MTALTQEVAVKQMQEQIRDVQQSILMLGELVAQHAKQAIEDRMLVNQMGELVNKLVLQSGKAATPRKTGNARQTK